MIANQYVRDDPSETGAPIRTIITLDNGGNWELVRSCSAATLHQHLHGIYSGKIRLLELMEYCIMYIINLA